MNWLDYALLALIVVTAITGIFKGFVKQVIGLAAVIAGLALAVLYYTQAAALFGGFVKDRTLANFLGFLFIFVLVLVAGGLLGHLLTKAMVGPLAFVNRLFGAVFGVITAVLVGGILVFAMVSFEISRPAVQQSVLAPACLGVARAVVHAVPKDLRQRFDESYKRIRESGGKHGQEI